MDWKRKLTSRKFWLAIADFVGMILIATGKDNSTVTQVTALIMAGAGVVGYLLAEGLADSANSTTAEKDEQ